eukprot:366009-Chlamydomonas_euryale.AAC.14
MPQTFPSEAECMVHCQSTGRALVSLTLSQSGETLGNIVISLFTDICPKTCENFMNLIKGKGSMQYQGSPIHRVVAKAYIQGGDVVDGTGKGDPKYELPDETFAVKHDAAGIIGMANNGQPHSGATQFYISLNPLPWMDGKRVAFGQVVLESSFGVLKAVEGLSLNNERPVPEVTISEARVLLEQTPVT